MQPGNLAPNSLGEMKWSVCDCDRSTRAIEDLLPWLSLPITAPPPSSPSQSGVLILLIVYAYPMFFTSSPLPPIHWHSLQEEGKMRALTALEDKFNRN